jgi:hypothetical protein
MYLSIFLFFLLDITNKQTSVQQAVCREMSLRLNVHDDGIIMNMITISDIIYWLGFL